MKLKVVQPNLRLLEQEREDKMRFGTTRSQIYDAQKTARAKWDATAEEWDDAVRRDHGEKIVGRTRQVGIGYTSSHRSAFNTLRSDSPRV